MTNAEKYKTAKKRSEAFNDFCSQMYPCSNCPLAKLSVYCKFAWLEQKAAIAKPQPCPFCGGSDIRTFRHSLEGYWDIICQSCGATMSDTTKADVIAKWNRRAK